MREKIILDKLTSEENVTMKALVNELKVSDRTVRNELKLMNKAGENNGFKILNTRGSGYSLELINEYKFTKYMESINSLCSLDSNIGLEERVSKILEILLITNDYTTIDSISEKLLYSRSTIINDLEFVEKKLKFLNLELERKSSLGLKIVSEEITIRKSLSVYLYSNNRDLIIQNERDADLFLKVKKIFIEELVENKINISNLAIENIFCHLKILILRIDNQNFIKRDTTNKDMDCKFEKISCKIFDLIGKEFNITIPKREIDYLASQILYKSKVAIENNEIKEKARTDIEQILKSIDEISYTNFSKDVELKNNLLMHLCALISRARTNTQLKNPYFDEVNTRYSAIVSIVVNFTDIFCERWNMKLLKDEIAFIAIHFASHFEKAKLIAVKDVKKIAIVCPREGGMAYLLKLKLEEAFANTIITSYTNFQIDELLEAEYDFIITNTDITEKINIPLFKIENLFDDCELEMIVKKIEQQVSLKKDLAKEKLDDIFFQRKTGGSKVDYKEFLSHESKKLIELKIVPDDFEELVLRREESLSTAYKNNVAGPHAMEMNAYKNVLSITVFENYVDWNDKKVNIVCLIAVKKGSLNLHRVIGKQLFDVINNENMRIEISKCKSREDFIRIFK